MKRKLLCGVVVLLSLLASSCSVTEERGLGDVAAVVNGENIYDEEIRMTVEALKTNGIRYDTILTNSICELLMVQMASEYDIAVSQEEIDQYLTWYREQEPEIYAKGVETYGEPLYEEGLVRWHTFQLVKEVVLSEEIPEPEVSEQEIVEYLEKNGLTFDQLTNHELERVVARLKSSEREAMFRDWMMDQWDLADDSGFEYVHNIKVVKAYESAVTYLDTHWAFRGKEYDRSIVHTSKMKERLFSVVDLDSGKEQLLDITDWVITIGTWLGVDQEGAAKVPACIVCDSETFEAIGWIPLS